MIQRVQSIYLFLVFVVAIVLIFFPLATFSAGEHIFNMNIMGFDGTTDLGLELPNVMAIGILTAILGVLSLFTIFQYKNRKLQMKLNMVNMLVNFGLLAAIFIYADMVAALDDVTTEFRYDIAAYFPIASVLLLILSNRNIRADEKLVRQSERLR
jgi:peptidoglycan/LPS O-acetylase OafA/YrhL